MFRNRGNPQSGMAVVRQSVNTEHIILIFGVIVRDRSLFIRIKPNFTPDLLNNPGEEFHAAFLQMLHNFFDQHGELPVKQIAVAELLASSREHGAGFYEGIVEQEVDVIYDLGRDASPESLRATENYASDLIERLLIDRRVINPTRSLLVNSTGSTLDNPGDILNSANQSLLEIRRLMSSTLISSVPQIRSRVHNYVEFDHDMNFMNALTQGGLPRKSVSGLFGPFGSCKTTTATQAAASRINVEWRKYQRGEPTQIVVYANCEGSFEEISFRVLSFLAKIPARAVKAHYYGITPLRDFTPPDPEDYNNKHGMTVPETIRLAEAVEKIDKFLKIIDLSGGENSNNLGKGFVDDLSLTVQSYCQQSNMGISLFILDYAKAFTRRFMDMNNLAAENIRFYLGRLPDLIRRDIADKYDCAALVLQQMNKAANTKKPGQLLTHGDSSEASDFGENCWFCFCLSSPFKNEEGLSITNINMSKSRDVEPPRRMPALEYIPYCQGLRLRDEFTIVNNTLHYEERRSVIAPTGAAPLRRGSSRRVGTTGGEVTSADLNPLEGM